MTMTDPIDYFHQLMDQTTDDVDDACALELIDWNNLHDHGDEILEGLLIPGRWTAFAAGPKAGKTTLEMFVTVEISEGRDPFDGNAREPVTVLYIDAEMGRLDLEERIKDLGHDPASLTRWHATDMPPLLNTIPGGNAVVLAVQQLGAQVVVIDGLNGVVEGAEKDDTTWRPFFDCTIMPLKRMGVAILTGDNLGKDQTLGPRGSSVKMDKADAIIRLTRTDNGVQLTTTHRRTSAYPLELLLSIDGIDGDRPITYRRTDTAWPHGTEAAVKILDELGIPADDGRGKVRKALEGTTHRLRNDVLAAAIRYRRAHIGAMEFADIDAPGQVRNSGDRSGDRYLSTGGDRSGDRSTEIASDQGGDRSGDRSGQVPPDLGTVGGVVERTPHWPIPEPSPEDPPRTPTYEEIFE